nr:venom polypeptide precursor [Doratifera vulnerans]
MKYLVVFAIFALAFAAEEKKEDDKKDKRIFQRLIPADVLRDFPGMCFASTRCATVEPGNSWDLAPFCGRSSCVVSQDQPPRLLELVEDCGPLPLANPKCQLDTEKTNKTAPFPGCCPIFKCEDGVKLEYPEIPAASAEGEKPEVAKKEEEKPKA